MSNSNDTEQEAGMTDPNRLSNGMLVTGDSTVDWTIAEPKGRSGSAIDCVRKSVALTRLKMAVLAPMPRPRITTAAAVKRQSRTRRRTA